MSCREHWEDDPAYPVDDWKIEVAIDDTRLGYRDWVEARADMLGSGGSQSAAMVGPRRDAVRIRVTDRLGNIAYIHRELNRLMRCTLANGASASLFYAGITADQALAIVRRYGSLDHGYCHAGPPPGWDSASATPSAQHLLARLMGEIDRMAKIAPKATGQIDNEILKRARAFIAMELPPGSGGA